MTQDSDRNSHDDDHGSRDDGDQHINIEGNVDNSSVVSGDNNVVGNRFTVHLTNVLNPINIFRAEPQDSRQLSKKEYKWRQVLVKNIKRYWIEGILEKNLNSQVLVELGLEERSSAVVSPFHEMRESSSKEDTVLPKGTEAINIFDALSPGCTLLILGEPGAGKTTTLLNLAKNLLTQIGDDISKSIPVVLNLSTWAKKRQPIEKWLEQELYESYGIARSIGKRWIKEDQLILCLDGLDEVTVDYRESCVQEINKFLKNHGLAEIIVCSRIRDYENLSKYLKVGCAVYVQLLTEEQVDQYLLRAGKQLIGLKSFLNQNPEIKEFATTPLVLNVMSLAYQGYNERDIPRTNSLNNFQHALLEAYISRMFRRRMNVTIQYPENHSRYWLSWLARYMKQQAQPIFLIEGLQPTCLRLIQRIKYHLKMVLIYGVTFGFVVWIVSYASLLITTNDARSSLFFSSCIGCVAGLLPSIITLRPEIKPVPALSFSSEATKKTVLVCLFIGPFIWPVFWIVASRNAELIIELNPTAVNIFSMPFIQHVGICILVSLCLALLVSAVEGFDRGSTQPLSAVPNQGIWRSLRTASVVSLVTGPSLGVAAGLTQAIKMSFSFMLSITIKTGLRTFFLIAIIAGPMFGLCLGGGACLQHFYLRLTLHRLGHMPWNYARFLDYAVERIFLQRIGGRYIFIHRMLLEHFAQMELEPVSKKKR